MMGFDYLEENVWEEGGKIFLSIKFNSIVIWRLPLFINIKYRNSFLIILSIQPSKGGTINNIFF